MPCPSTPWHSLHHEVWGIICIQWKTTTGPPCEVKTYSSHSVASKCTVASLDRIVINELLPDDETKRKKGFVLFSALHLSCDSSLSSSAHVRHLSVHYRRAIRQWNNRAGAFIFSAPSIHQSRDPCYCINPHVTLRLTQPVGFLCAEQSKGLITRIQTTLAVFGC